jgi:hypothetical protein
VDYKLVKHRDEIFSKCPCMIDKDLEFVNAFSVYLKGEKTGSKYNDYINVCDMMGINDARKEIDKMIILDFLIRNTDRHVGNFGILRNSQTLKWERIAPVFDNGNSLWYNAQGVQFINADSKSDSRSFTGDNKDNVALVGNTGWFNNKKLDNFGQIMADAFKLNKKMENERIDKIISEFERNVAALDRLLKF